MLTKSSTYLEWSFQNSLDFYLLKLFHFKIYQIVQFHQRKIYLRIKRRELLWLFLKKLVDGRRSRLVEERETAEDMNFWCFRKKSAYTPSLDSLVRLVGVTMLQRNVELVLIWEVFWYTQENQRKYCKTYKSGIFWIRNNRNLICSKLLPVQNLFSGLFHSSPYMLRK